MDNAKVTRTWGVAAAIIAAVVGVAAAALSISTLAKAQVSQQALPSVVVQWQPQSILETKFMARINEDNKIILGGLQALAKDPEMTPEAVADRFKDTYLRTPRLWTKTGWVDGWEKVLPQIRGLIARGSRPVITSVSAVIEYLPSTGAPTAAEDIDARATIRVTFSASPGENILSGVLCHSRICEIVPCGGITG